MNKEKKRYINNRGRVYDIYGIEKEKRSNTWGTHHIVEKENGGGNEKANLFPTPRGVHELIHDPEANGRTIHWYCEREFGGDPYQK